MAVNSTSFLSTFHRCHESEVGVSITTTFFATKFVLFPLYLLVLYLGHQRWRQQRSFATTSHSAIFTYHLAAVELIYVLGATLYFCGIFSGLPKVRTVAIYFCAVGFPGETSFHILTCVERYLAVVHPVIYRRLRQSAGVRIRNIIIGCVWLLSFAWIGVIALFYPDPPYILYFCILVFSLIIVSFCSLSVLCVLIRPGPGEKRGVRARIDQSKQKAFHTIAAILGVLWLYFLGYLVSGAFYNSRVLHFIGECVIMTLGNFVTLPSCLILPLLFLHRAGKLHCCHGSKK